MLWGAAQVWPLKRAAAPVDPPRPKMIMLALPFKPSHLLKTVLRGIAVVALGLSLQACAVIAVADAAVTVVATGVKVTAKAVGAVAEAVIPGGD